MQEELDRLLSTSGASMAQVIQPSQGGPPMPGMFEIRSLISQLYTKTCQAKVGLVIWRVFEILITFLSVCCC